MSGPARCSAWGGSHGSPPRWIDDFRITRPSLARSSPDPSSGAGSTCQTSLHACLRCPTVLGIAVSAVSRVLPHAAKPCFSGVCDQSHLRDSNPGLQLYESCALPTELRWRSRASSAHNAIPRRFFTVRSGRWGVKIEPAGAAGGRSFGRGPGRSSGRRPEPTGRAPPPGPAGAGAGPGRRIPRRSARGCATSPRWRAGAASSSIVPSR